MRFKAATLAVSLTLASISAVGVAASPAFAASCPDNAWSTKDGRVGHFFASNGINIRTGPSTSCTAVGQGQASHSVRVDCWKGEPDGTWSHLRDNTTGVSGWSRDDNLVGTGALVHC